MAGNSFAQVALLAPVKILNFHIDQIYPLKSIKQIYYGHCNETKSFFHHHDFMIVIEYNHFERRKQEKPFLMEQEPTERKFPRHQEPAITNSRFDCLYFSSINLFSYYYCCWWRTQS
ncbi:hypothetical protein DERF_004053 [Dermatophagoides farinae]|uniref:Uncharacterized protein n=1 Tax=Dermatophagoides farinae TaxID=6954 RepID=A0A922IGJ7_DERFA|nr:hypothetical protein DERF_004053 [Dermatophagoides farinae]